jgi:hypothetical protein
MANNTRTRQAALTGHYGAIVKRMSLDMLGVVPDPVGVA